MTLSGDEVLRWAAEWIYVPQGSPTVDVEEYLLAAYPLTWSDPTGAFRIASERPAAALVDDVMASAADLDRSAVTFWINDATRPAGVGEELLARGGTLHEELAVLARPIDGPGGAPDIDVPDDIEIRLSTDLATERDMDLVATTVFGGTRSPDDVLQQHVDERDPALDAVFVAYRDGVPVGTAGMVFAGEVARLWGGCVLERARGAGVYRALLARRFDEGRARGCRAALVRGRLTTSAPTLRRAGFSAYGEERGYRLDSAAPWT